MNAKGISEVLGYILVFSIVAVIISVVYVQVYPELQKQQANAVFDSMENTFLVFHDVEKLVAYGVTPSKSVKVRVSSGSLYAEPDFGKIYVDINGSKNYSCEYGAVIYEQGTSKILLDDGAVLEGFGDQYISIVNPDVVKNSDNIYISIVNVSGRKTVFGLSQLCFENNGSCILIPTTFARSVKITFDTPTHDWWVNYFEKLGFKIINNYSVSINNVNITVALHNVSLS